MKRFTLLLFALASPAMAQVSVGSGGSVSIGSAAGALPLSGGTLSGPLIGTDATFSGVTATTVQVAAGTTLTANQGTGEKVQHSTGTPTPSNCANFDATGNTADAGNPCPVVSTGTAQAIAYYAGNGIALSPISSYGTGAYVQRADGTGATGAAAIYAAGTLTNSPLVYDGANFNSSAPFYIGAGFFLNPTATATNVANYQSFAINEYASYWNGSAAVQAQAQQYLWVGSGTTPQVIEDHYYPAGLTNLSVLYAQNAANVATVSVSVNTPKFILRGATWNGSASQLDNWNLQGVEGVGTNPTSTLTFTHNGSSGSAIVSMPALTITGGTPGIQLTAAAFATYPACSGPNEGLEEAVTDSTTVTWGATVTGGGANHIKMFCDGTNWTVEAK